MSRMRCQRDIRPSDADTVIMGTHADSRGLFPLLTELKHVPSPLHVDIFDTFGPERESRRGISEAIRIAIENATMHRLI